MTPLSGSLCHRAPSSAVLQSGAPRPRTPLFRGRSAGRIKITRRIIHEKKTLAAVAVLGAFAGSAMIADVELYGIVDTGIGDQHVD